MGRKKPVEREQDGHVWWKICSHCGELKRISEFPLKSLWKKLSSGRVKRYDYKRTTVCHQCTFWRDRGRKKYKTRDEIRPKMKGVKKVEMTRKQRELMSALTPSLHPYHQKTL